jgi:hypothetical protein
MKKVVVALGIVLLVQCAFALCLISALQLLVPRNMPFAVTGASKVVNAVTSKVSLETISYATNPPCSTRSARARSTAPISPARPATR